ncbi:MAG TPA: tripartite tricarboxylate transporter substrate binding protein [Burkholderiaceae bacterium]|nr:tripartite tricarboxylate transporter substrate binding protein [Burkholderiaceae bacterium]
MNVILAAGGPTDVLARAVASGMSDQLGQPVIVDNKPGAGGGIASAVTAKAKPDGYTLLMTVNTAHTLLPYIQKGLGYDPVKDFTPISIIGTTYNVIVVNKDFPAQDFKGLIELAKAKPESVSVAVFGIGGRYASARLAAATGVKFLEIPYKGGAQGTQALMSGEVNMFYDGAGLVDTRVKSGMYRAIAVLSKTRSPVLPDVPAVGEYIPGFEVPLWFGVVAPAGLPEKVKERLHKALIASLDTPKVKAAAAALGLEMVGNTPAEFAKRIREEAKATPDLVRRYKITID